MKKKLKSSFGDIVIPNKHPLAQMANSFRMTRFLQDQVCFIGQKEVFEEGSETILRLMGIDVTNKQIQRVSEHYGQRLEAEAIEGEEQLTKISYEEKGTSEYRYGMVDGSMVFTKEEKWKEIKLGRVFKGSENIPISESRHWIKDSAYCAYLGSFEPFLERFEYLLTGFPNIIFIADGAKWFWDWATTFYPQAIQILDFYHAKEYLCGFAKLVFQDKQQRIEWVNLQQELLFQDKVDVVITGIKAFTGLVGDALEFQEKIVTYYENNRMRMHYKTYKEKGFLIGSGPIESAHRNIIQKRLKLSGQRWSMPGVQQIANLRIAHKSSNWHRVIEMIKEVKIIA